LKYFATRISENLHKTPEGYLLAMGVPIGRVGSMDYGHGETPLKVGPDGIVKVSRDAEELFRPETMASFEGKPLTIRHPEDFVSSENWKDLAKGIMKNVRRKGDDLIADILLTDQFAISLVENGMRQLSCGYEAEYIQTGEGKGIQKNIVGNHLALVEEGRAGDAYKINDAKGVSAMNKKLEAALKKLFGKTTDQILQEAADKTAAEKAAKAKKSKTGDNKAYDELVALCKDLGEKVAKFGQPNDEEEQEEAPVKKKKKDDAPAEDEGEEEKSLEERLKAVEAAVSKLLEAKSGDESEEEEAVDEEEEEEVVVDEEASEEAEDEESEEAEDEGPQLTGDEKSRVEILAPGLSPTKDFKVQALKTAWKSDEGQKAIRALTGDKKPEFKAGAQTDMLFTATSELLKHSRGTVLAGTKKKTTDFNSVIFQEESAMTPEKLNEKMAQHYNPKKA
jgi:hypothetical protein